jgi:hypothetical protein
MIDLYDMDKYSREKLHLTAADFQFLTLTNNHIKALAFKEPSVSVDGLTTRQHHALMLDKSDTDMMTFNENNLNVPPPQLPC